MIINTNQIDTKAYTALILSVFDNLQLETDNGLFTIKLVYGNNSRLYKKLANKSDSITYRTPIMNIIETANTINLERSTNRLLKRKKLDINGQTVQLTYNSTPVDFMFELNIVSDTLTTMSALKETIISKFHNNTYYVDYISPLGETISTPIILNEITPEIDNEEDNYNGNRFISCRLVLTVEGFITNKWNTTGNKITLIETILSDYSNNINKILDTYTIEG